MLSNRTRTVRQPVSQIADMVSVPWLSVTNSVLAVFPTIGFSYNYCVLSRRVQTTSAAGLDVLGRIKPDLMIVDYAMPGMTGTELSERARAIHDALPIIFASGYAETRALERAADDRTFALRKPFRLSELQRALTRALGR